MPDAHRHIQNKPEHIIQEISKFYRSKQGAVFKKNIAQALEKFFPNAAISKQNIIGLGFSLPYICLLYTSPSPRDGATSRMPSSA